MYVCGACFPNKSWWFLSVVCAFYLYSQYVIYSFCSSHFMWSRVHIQPAHNHFQCSRTRTFFLFSFYLFHHIPTRSLARLCGLGVFMALTDWHARHVFIHFHYSVRWRTMLSFGMFFIEYFRNDCVAARHSIKNWIKMRLTNILGLRWMKNLCICKKILVVLCFCLAALRLNFNSKAWHFWHSNYLSFLPFNL